MLNAPSHRPIPVWGFPIGYNPNRMNEICERCRRTGLWQGRVVPDQPFMAWTCQCSTQTAKPTEIPLD